MTPSVEMLGEKQVLSPGGLEPQILEDLGLQPF